MLRFTRRAGALLFGAGMLALPAFVTLSAQSTKSAAGMKEDKPGQLALAKVTPDAARKIALARVPKGTISEEGIEKEKGKLLYSFDIKVPGKRGIKISPVVVKYFPPRSVFKMEPQPSANRGNASSLR